MSSDMTQMDVPLAQMPPVASEPPHRTMRLGRVAVFGLLFAAFDLAFILSPYWRLANAPSHQYALLALTTLMGLRWAYISSGELEIRFSTRSLWLLLLLLVTLALLNARALTQGIAFRGDEELHADRTVKLMAALTGKSAWAAIGLLLTGVVSLGVVVRLCRKHWQAAFVCVAAVGLQLVLLHAFKLPTLIQRERLVRYPLFETWFTLPPVLLAGIAIPLAPPWHNLLCEAVFRMVPFLSAVLLAWYAGKKLSPNPSPGRSRPVARVLFALAVGTMPMIFYYSSVAYLELPAVLMMTIVCFGATELLSAEFGEVKRHRAWYALLLIGFLKETALPFLAAFAVCRIAMSLLALWKGKRTWRSLLGDLQLCIAIFVPLAVYLFYRHLGGVKREMSPELGQLLDHSYYAVLAKAYAQQFGPLALFSLGGVIVMLWQRRFAALIFFAAAFAADAGLHLIDNQEFIGYSRFNLFLTPMVIVAAWYAIDALLPPGAWAGLALVIAVNFSLSPVHLDGSKVADWGQYFFDTTDQSYPYREAIRWLNHQHGDERILFTGLWFKYPIKLYAKKGLRYEESPNSKSHERDDAKAIERALGAAGEDGFDVVVYHLYHRPPPVMKPERMSGFKQIKLFQNSAHALVVYEQQDKSAGPTTAPGKSLKPEDERSESPDQVGD
jgi:hypothetical protein